MSINRYGCGAQEVCTFTWDRGLHRWAASYRVGAGPIIDIADTVFRREEQAHQVALSRARESHQIVSTMRDDGPPDPWVPLVSSVRRGAVMRWPPPVGRSFVHVRLAERVVRGQPRSTLRAQTAGELGSARTHPAIVLIDSAETASP
ncbi:hypothetical protein AACH06_28270 [Ideonella sp. DXS29W]|uniref:Uncharacterized protein n=1 Tax=Ideonella lacteola TaxID=2984193 RepID=A0ABU9BXM7_9BURK